MSTAAISRRSYIALSAYNNDLYKYTITLNPQTLQEITTLEVNPQANPSNCPAQRVLHENGRRINPPEGNYPGIINNVVTYMVGVYDPITGLSGFINPNSPTFAIFNTDKPNYLSPGVDPKTSLGNLGNPVLTRGDVLAGGNLDVSGNILVHTDLNVFGNADVSGNIVGHQQIRCDVNTPYDLSGGVIDVDITLGNLATVTVTNNQSNTINFENYFGFRGSMITLLIVNGDATVKTISFGEGVHSSSARNNQLVLDLNAKYSVTFVSDGIELYETARTASYLNSSAIGNIVATGTSYMGDVNAVVVGPFKKLFVSAQGCTPSSRVFLTYSGLNNPGFLSAEEIGVNTFRIVSSNDDNLCTVYWMVVNNVYGL